MNIFLNKNSYSCAERGIRNAFVANNDEMVQRGVLIPSNGNTALGAAYHGGLLRIPVNRTIYIF